MGIEDFGTSMRPIQEGMPMPPGMCYDKPQQIVLGNADSGNKRWASAKGGQIFYEVGETANAVPVGFYRIEVADCGMILSLVRNDTDSLIHLPDSESERILDEIGHFLTIRDRFTERGLLYKRGILLYGPPGSGKTATVQLLAKMLAEKTTGISILADGRPELVVAGLQMIRRIEPDRQIVVIIEDIDALVSRNGEESYLSMLDGESNVENVVFIATTNYPERLDRRFVDRPSRFDTVRMIGMPTAEARRLYLSSKDKTLSDGILGLVRLNELVEASEGYSIAHLRELMVLVQCFGRTIAEAKERLDAMRETHPSSERGFGTKGVGFLNGSHR